MIKLFVFSLVLLFSVNCLAQEADSSNNDFDSEIRKDPTSFPEEIIELDKIKLPASLAQFSGIRFVDIRADSLSIGFVKLKNEHKKIVFLNGLANEINTKLTISNSVEITDSLIIYIKNFWVTRLPLVEVIRTEEKWSGQLKEDKEMPESICHITTAYFIKNLKGLTFSGKLDTFFTSKKKLSRCYSTLPDDATAIILGETPAAPKESSRYFTEAQVLASLQKQIEFPASSVMEEGIFLNYSDFKKGILLKKSFTLTPRITGYKIEFSNIMDANEFSNNFWGICYKNQFYIRCGYEVNKLWKTGHTYITMTGSPDFYEEKLGLLKTKVLGRGGLLDPKFAVSKKDKSSYAFIPMLLNPLTGRLE